ncbi:MAG: alginate lyase family protein [Ignavibacteriae bacterium]|nr:alginate lyase family protein [Ignavibacteriota bacterium]
MKIIRKIRQGLSLPPRTAMRMVYEQFARPVRHNAAKKLDTSASTYSHKEIPELHSYFTLPPIEELQSQERHISMLAELYCSHRFDLLGSGWTQVKYGMECRGTEGIVFPPYTNKPSVNDEWLSHEISPLNLKESQRIWAIVDKDYTPIDWQLDFKSGFRWSAQSWCKSIRYGGKAGVDVKVPWELARMQHLPTLAQAAALSGKSEEQFHPREKYIAEFRNQIIDFIALNPPRFGVNWTTSMDIAIRAVNWLISYDYFHSIGCRFDEDFEKIFRRSIYEHGKHIINNLEYSPILRGNHYLADIAGLLFIAAYLPSTPETDMWLAFSVQEMIAETKLQFLPDGGNFEASVPYHRLSAEMVIYAAALLEKLPPDKVVSLSNYNYRLKKGAPKLKSEMGNYHSLKKRIPVILRFAELVAKQNGHSPQIGDNDSGRFFKLLPNYVEMSTNQARSTFLNLKNYKELLDDNIYLVENHNDHSELQKIEGLLNCPSLSGKIPDRELELVSFDNFGLDIYRKKNYFCTVRCGSIGQRGKGGHAHNDQLSIELNVRGQDVFVDGGTYLYTPAADMRNHFRSTSAHNTVIPENKEEQNLWLPGGGDALFWMLGDRSKGTVVHKNEKEWKGYHSGFGAHKHIRTLSMTEINITGIDEFEGEQDVAALFHCAPDVTVVEKEDDGHSVLLRSTDVTVRFVSVHHSIDISDNDVYSAGYGILQNAILLSISGHSPIEWSIEIL